MSKIKYWWSDDRKWFCILVNDGNASATVSLTPEEAGVLSGAAEPEITNLDLVWEQVNALGGIPADPTVAKALEIIESFGGEDPFSKRANPHSVRNALAAQVEVSTMLAKRLGLTEQEIADSTAQARAALNIQQRAEK